MNKFATLFEVGRTFGLRDGAFRLGYELQRATGLMDLRLRAAAGWDRWNLKHIANGATGEELLRARRSGEHPFFFSDARALGPRLKLLVGSEGERSVLTEAQSILDGDLPFFGRLSFACGFPPNWFRNPGTGQSVSPQRPWTTMRFASPDYGDLKFILEPSRFLFVYPMARAYALTTDERYPEAFWLAIEDWADKNPPMAGPLWICGQESALRILAWSFGLYAFIHAAATTPERATRLLAMIAAHAWRIEQTLAYARSQRSNHLVTEAVGLWTAGVLYPELRAAGSWQQLGTRMLQEAVLDQITPEGVYLQDSFNYQRMVLQLLLWTLRLAEIHKISLSADIRSRTAACFDFIRAFVDPISGHAPNHGSNDGSLILPLSICDHGDFRPLLQSGASVLFQKSVLEPGPWDEATLWLCGHAPPAATTGPWPVPSPGSGYHRLGTECCWAMIRAGQYVRRPFQADQLHVDLWWRGLNLARDAGTYLYNGDPPWNNGFAGTAVHNTVMLDRHDQMQRAGRFLWVDWAQATGRSFASGDSVYPDSFEGEHDGYRRFRVRHLRTVRFLDEVGWVIVDDLLGTGEHEARLHWLIADMPLQVLSASPLHATFAGMQASFQWHVLSDAAGAGSVIEAGKDVAGGLANAATQLGWESPTYGELRPALSLLYRSYGQLPIRFVTVVLVGNEVRLQREANRLEIWRADSCIYQTAVSSRSRP